MAGLRPRTGATVQFGISTHLFHDQRLIRDHLLAIRAHGFTHVEVFATRSHFDYHEPGTVDALARWIDEAGLRLHAIHAPVVEAYRRDGVSGPLSTAVTDPARRRLVLREAEQALALARRLPCGFLVVHLGQPEGAAPLPGDNDPESARQSVLHLREVAAAHGVQLALEVIPNRLSTVPALTRLIDADRELSRVGLCLDFGHAFLAGDVVDAVEQAAGHLVTTHVHDNDGRGDDHLVPFEGAIAWDEVVIACQKVGYEGVWMLEVANTSTPEAVLARARSACDRLVSMLSS